MGFPDAKGSLWHCLRPFSSTRVVFFPLYFSQGLAVKPHSNGGPFTGCRAPSDADSLSSAYSSIPFEQLSLRQFPGVPGDKAFSGSVGGICHDVLTGLQFRERRL